MACWLVGWVLKKKPQPLKPTYLYPGNHFEVVKTGQQGSVQLNLSTWQQCHKWGPVILNKMFISVSVSAMLSGFPVAVCLTVTHDKSQVFAYPLTWTWSCWKGEGGGRNQWLTNGNVLTLPVSAHNVTAVCHVLFNQHVFFNWFKNWFEKKSQHN